MKQSGTAPPGAGGNWFSEEFRSEKFPNTHNGQRFDRGLGAKKSDNLLYLMGTFAAQNLRVVGGQSILRLEPFHSLRRMLGLYSLKLDYRAQTDRAPFLEGRATFDFSPR